MRTKNKAKYTLTFSIDNLLRPGGKDYLYCPAAFFEN